MADQQHSECLVCHLGLISYTEALELQRKLVELRFREAIGDTLLVLQHLPTVTVGKFGKTDNILASPDELARRGISICPSDRGGDVTFHCPGQLVVYPIMDLRHREGTLRGYITDLEEVAIRVLHDYGITAERWPEHPGIWVNGKQIGAIGLRVSHGISMHGLSLNVNPDLKSFEVINLCGLPGKKATSITAQLGHDVSFDEVVSKALDEFCSIYKTTLNVITREQLEGDLLGATTA